jgi:hypothetical protein
MFLWFFLTRKLKSVECTKSNPFSHGRDKKFKLLKYTVDILYTAVGIKFE